MAALKFTNDAAKRLEALYATADVVAQRSETLRKLHLAEGNSVIDLGSGPGFLFESVADIVGPSGRVLVIDISSDLIELSARRNRCRWLSYRVGDATGIDEPDESFDVATCTQVAEYIPAVDKAISETFRILRPGGRAVFVATDWDGVIWYSDIPARMAAVMKSWEAHCAHPRLPASWLDGYAPVGSSWTGRVSFRSSISNGVTTATAKALRGSLLSLSRSAATSATTSWQLGLASFHS